MFSARQTIELAMQHHAAGRIADAEKLYREALSRNPDDVDATRLLGVIARQTGHVDDAMKLLRRAVELAPGRPFVWRRQGPAVSALVVGYVAQEPGVIRFPSLAAGVETDVPAALFTPRPMSLAESGLAGVMDSSADADHAHDLLLSPADVRGGFAIPPARRLHRTGASWFEGTTAADTLVLRPGAGFLIRMRGERPARYWRQAISN